MQGIGSLLHQGHNLVPYQATSVQIFGAMHQKNKENWYPEILWNVLTLVYKKSEPTCDLSVLP